MVSFKTWDTVSERAKVNRWQLEHFHGYSLQCSVCERSFRCFREFETVCGCCKSLGADCVNGML